MTADPPLEDERRRRRSHWVRIKKPPIVESTTGGPCSVGPLLAVADDSGDSRNDDSK